MTDRFETTQWSVVQQAGGEGDAARDALSVLCRIYRPPVFAYVRAHRPRDTEAEDLTQAFFVHFLERDLPARADPGRGRFRAFLLTALKNFLAQEHGRARAQRHGGRMQRAPDTLLETLADPSPTPDDAFELEWARTVLREAMRRLEQESDRAGKAKLFAELRPYLVDGPDRSDYESLAEANGLRRNTIAVAVHRLRGRLQALVRDVLADTVRDAGDVDEELRHIRGMLDRPR